MTLDEKFDKLIEDAEKTWSKGVKPIRYRTFNWDIVTDKCSACLLAAAVIESGFRGDPFQCPVGVDRVAAKAAEQYGIPIGDIATAANAFDTRDEYFAGEPHLDKIIALSNKLFPKKTTCQTKS